jgi:hypothetical protein
MLLQTLKPLFDRDLRKLRSEIEAYRTEANIWRVEEGIANSAGNLCLHLVGNLNWFIGAQLAIRAMCATVPSSSLPSTCPVRSFWYR